MAKAKKKGGRKAVEKKVWTIALDAEASTYDNGDGEDSSEPYSYRGTTTTDWTVRGLRLMKNDSDYISYRAGDSTQVAFEPVVGETYHALYAIYSTGDSFGHDYGYCLELVGVYKDKAVAEENRKRCLQECHSWDEATVKLKVEGVKTLHKYYRPWTGYFDRLDHLELESFTLV